MQFYRRLCSQPYSLNFKHEFEYLTDEKGYGEERGKILLQITVNGITYGPYDSGIRSTLNVWKSRRGFHINEEVVNLNWSIRKYEDELDVAYSCLDKSNLIVGTDLLDIVEARRNK